MHGFEPNNCRVCQKVFCCKTCRTRHEKNAHHIFPDCDICVYGIFFLENFGDGFLHHLEFAHLPVHCVYCKKVFNSVEDLLQHRKCRYFESKEISPKTPFKTPPGLICVNEHDSPIQELQTQDHLNYILATSTPMHRSEEPNLMFEKSKEVVTPVDKPIRASSKSIIKKVDSTTNSDDNLSKRRVTFVETPSLNILEKNMKERITENGDRSGHVAELALDGQSVSQKLNEENFTPVTGMSCDQFYSAKSETGQCYSARTEISSRIIRKNKYGGSDVKNVLEGFTPVTGMNKAPLNDGETEFHKFCIAHAKMSSKNVRENSNGSSEGKNLTEDFTPVTGMSTAPLYDAKTELDKFYIAKVKMSSKNVRKNNDGSSDVKNLAEGLTPVGITNRLKTINMVDSIYAKEDRQINGNKFLEIGNMNTDHTNQDNLSEISMELCTPAKSFQAVEKVLNVNEDDKGSLHNAISPVVETGNGINECNLAENELDIYTPAKTSNPGKIVTKGNIYKNSNHENNFPVVEMPKKEQDGQNNQKGFENKFETSKTETPEVPEHDTLWLSALNLEDNDDLKQNDENKHPADTNETVQEENKPLNTIKESPQGENQKTVSTVMPTPILETTNVQMKFQFPALSSTPIIVSSDSVTLKQTRIIKTLSNNFLQPQTPYKTPQGKLCDFLQRKLVDANFQRNTDILSTIEAGRSTAGRDVVLFKSITEDDASSNTAVHGDVVCVPNNEHHEDSYSSLSSDESKIGVSVSSMTESSLWTSMTRIVKSVLGGFSSNNNSKAFKRQLSDSDSGDFHEAPRLKRFKFTDIKCRRTIRALPVLQITQSIPPSLAPMANIEIVKSVSTVYGHQTVKIKCDKATQTDNYLLYGWRPFD